VRDICLNLPSGLRPGARQSSEMSELVSWRALATPHASCLLPETGASASVVRTGQISTLPGSCVASLVSQAVKSNPWRRHRQAAITAWRATVPINRRTARSNRDEPPSSTTAASPVTITRPDGTTVTEPPQPPGRSVCAFEKPEPPGGGGRLEWERRLTRSLASGSWWRGVAPTMLGSMPSMTAGVGACGQTAAESLAVSLRRRGSPKAVEDVLLSAEQAW